MSRLLLIFAMIVMAMPAVVHGDPLSRQAPVKAVRVVVPPPADPEVVRQGGDTIENATVIVAIPYSDEGTTTGYTDDYDEICPYDTPGSPDVVYSFTPSGDAAVDVDLCGSSYDTKLYVYDADLNLVACNDDYYFDDECGEYVSFLYAVPMNAGIQYFIVIDGYGGAFGDYVLSVVEFAGPCILDCPPEGFPEGEPDLVDGYQDEYNNGCASPGPPVFQSLDFGPSFLDFCAVTGWFIFEGNVFRDTDWFTATVGELGMIEVTADAESSTYIFELDVPPDCSASVIQNTLVGPCSPGTFTIPGDPGEVVYLWAGSSNFENPGDVEGNMYDYILTIDGLAGSATETHTWSQVKGLYR